METKEATRTCSQCKKEVAEVNFALHETHCSRFLCVCPDCGETVPRELLSQHKEEQHTMVRCSKCNQKMERCNLTDHESDECVERLQSCQFCEVELPWKDLEEHQLACGSRTELCVDCGRYVTLRDQPEHDSTCSATDNSSGPRQTTSKPPTAHITVPCNKCMTSIPVEDIDQHKLDCSGATRSGDEEEESVGDKREDDSSRTEAFSWLSRSYKSASLSGRASSDPWANGGDPDQISTCPHCHLALPILTLQWHMVKCQIHIQLK